MTYDESKAREALSKVGKLSGRLIMRPGSNEKDAVCVASALMQAAETIFLSLGGPELAAAQFQDVADRLSEKAH